MAAGISREARMRRARRIADRVRALARAAGWQVTPPVRGQATTATVTAPDGRMLYMRMAWTTASNGEAFGRLLWLACYPGELGDDEIVAGFQHLIDPGRRYRDVPDRFDTGGAPGMAEGEALSAYVLSRRPNADGFALAALRVLDALQPHPMPAATA